MHLIIFHFQFTLISSVLSRKNFTNNIKDNFFPEMCPSVNLILKYLLYKEFRLQLYKIMTQKK